MERTEFLKLIKASSSGFLLGAGKLTSTYLDVGLQEVVIYDNYLKGVSYNKIAIKKVNPQLGEPARLEREPNNMYDSFAIKVYIREVFIGYIPAYENIVLANLLDAGATLNATVSKVGDIDEAETNYYQKAIAINVSTKLLLPINNTTIIKNKRANEAYDIYRYGPYHKDFDKR